MPNCALPDTCHVTSACLLGDTTLGPLLCLEHVRHRLNSARICCTLLPTNWPPASGDLCPLASSVPLVEDFGFKVALRGLSIRVPRKLLLRKYGVTTWPPVRRNKTLMYDYSYVSGCQKCFEDASSSMNSVIKDMVSLHCQSDSLNIEAMPTTRSAKILKFSDIPTDRSHSCARMQDWYLHPEQIPKSRCSGAPLKARQDLDCCQMLIDNVNLLGSTEQRVWTIFPFDVLAIILSNSHDHPKGVLPITA